MSHPIPRNAPATAPARAARAIAAALLAAALMFAPTLGRAQADAAKENAKDEAGAAKEKDFDAKAFIAKMSPKIVTVKFILKMSMGQMDDEETETEVSGVMIDPKGLVICSNTQMGGFMAMMQKLMGGGGPQLSATPSDLKILVGDDVEGVEAELVARDTESDLAWLRIKDPGDKTYDFVDLTQSTTLDVGDPILTVSRMGKRFDRLAIYNSGRVVGIAKKPRDLYIPGGGVSGYGTPVFSRDGVILGMSAFLAPDPSENSGGPMAMMGMMSGGGDMAPAIIPASEVEKATKLAVEGYGANKEPKASASGK